MSTHYLGRDYVYLGGCEKIRVPGLNQKDGFRGEELIVGNKYTLIGALGDCNENVDYLRVKNEYEQEIYVPEIYFEEYIN